MLRCLNIEMRLDVQMSPNPVKPPTTFRETNLIKLGQSSEYTSLMIHKVGSTLFLDDFDIKTELLDKQSASHHWFKSILTNILCKGQNYSQVEAEFLSCISRLSGPELRSILSLESKFLYQ